MRDSHSDRTAFRIGLGALIVMGILFLLLAALLMLSARGQTVIVQWPTNPPTNTIWADTPYRIGLNHDWAPAAFYRVGWDTNSVFIEQATNLVDWQECYRAWVTNANGQAWRLRIDPALLLEDFSSGSMPPNWREWDGQVHSKTWDYSGSNAIAGHPSIGFSSGNPELAIGAFCGLVGSYNSLSVSFLFRANGTSLEVCDLYDPNGDEICDVYLVSSRQLVLQAGASNKATSAIPLNTTVRVWIRYQAIAPGQSKASLAWALEGEAEPTSGPQCARNASAAYATPACKLLFGPVITDGVVFSYAALKVSQ